MELHRLHESKVICLQETHIHSLHNIPMPPNFTIIEKNTANNSHGGVAMLVHNSIQYDRLTMNHDFDAVGIVLHSKMKVRLITTYIPPDKSLTWLTCLETDTRTR